jgi:transcriptional regulator of acetoin/glycerol metabolism
MAAVVLRIPGLGPQSFEQAERAVLVRALRDSGGHAETAADLLGIGASTIYRKIVDHDITEAERG